MKEFLDLRMDMEVRVERVSTGRRAWKWFLERGASIVSEAPTGFRGAEEAWEAGRKELRQVKARALSGDKKPASVPPAG